MQKYLLICLIMLASAVCHAQTVILPGNYLPVFPGSWWKYLDSNGDTIMKNTGPAYVRDSTSCDFSASQHGCEYALVPVWDNKKMWKYASSEHSAFPYNQYRNLYYELQDTTEGVSWYMNVDSHISNVYRKRKVLRRDTSLVVRGTFYDSVLVIREFLQGTGPFYQKDHYYSYRTGLIKTFAEWDYGSGLQSFTEELIDHHINRTSTSIAGSFSDREGLIENPVTNGLIRLREDADVMLYDINGRKVRSAFSAEMRVSDLDNGIYILSGVKDGRSRFTTKVIIIN